MGGNGGILSLGSGGHTEKKGLNTGTLVSSRWKNWKSADMFFNCGKLDKMLSAATQYLIRSLFIPVIRL
jgi:hypothetical protein